METIPHFLSTYGYLGIFLLLMVGIVGLPIPDEVVLAFAGYMVFKGFFHPLPTVLTALLGTFCGITVSYSLGRSLGFYFLQKYGHNLHISLERLARVQSWFHRVGKWAIFFGYFIMGVRHLTALTAGASRVRFRVFALFAYSGGFLWALSYICLGYFLGEELPKLSPELRQGFFIGSGIVILSISAFFIFRYFKNRRLAS
ncbi:MAG: DedA family protein [Deltaproteobacteria bacterium]|nr:DedA family protein [Deltaproteobacteria bacterium]MBI4796283.1 DedA family protein [Deltaproteobacteria bacterium]